MKTRAELEQELIRLELISPAGAIGVDSLPAKCVTTAKWSAEVLRWVLEQGAEQPSQRIVQRWRAAHKIPRR